MKLITQQFFPSLQLHSNCILIACSVNSLCRHLTKHFRDCSLGKLADGFQFLTSVTMLGATFMLNISSKFAFSVVKFYFISIYAGLKSRLNSICFYINNFHVRPYFAVVCFKYSAVIQQLKAITHQPIFYWATKNLHLSATVR